MDALIESEMTYWVSFRAMFQLNTSERRIARLARTEQGQLTMLEYSAPLSAAEARHVEARYQMEEDASNAETVLASRPGFAGLYIDNDRKGIVVIQTTERLDRSARRAVKRMFTQPRKVEFQVVENSYVELNDLFDQVVEEVDGRASVRLDVENNKVVVAGAPSLARAMAPDTMADAAVAMSSPTTSEWLETNCSSRDDCAGDFRAGLSLSDYLPFSTGDFRVCTSGFMVNTPATQFSPAGVAMLTAGHCTLPSEENLQESHRFEVAENGISDSFGLNTYWADTPVYNSDAVLLTVPAGRESNDIYKSASTPAQNVRWVLRGKHSKGTTVCLGSYRLGDSYRCGRISDSRTTVDLASGRGVTNAAVMKFTLPEPLVGTCVSRLGGSSGGAITARAGKKAVGIVHACSTDDDPEEFGNTETTYYVAYSKIKLVEEDLGVTVKVN